MKKHVLLLAAIFVLCNILRAQGMFTYLASYRDAPLYGFADSAGNTKSPGRYNLIMQPSEGICRVWAGQQSGNDYANIRYGFCFPEGTELVPPQYVKAEDFSEGMALVAITNGSAISGGFRHGFVNNKGLVQITPQYASAKSFSQGLAPVSTSEKEWKYIDKKGAVKIEGPFLDADMFSEGLAGVSVPYDLGQGVMSFRKGYIDLTGKMVIQPEYNYVMPFKNGYAVVSFSGSTPAGYKNYQILIDKSGKKITTQEFISIHPYAYEGLWPVKIKGSSGLSSEKDEWGVIDNKGKLYGARFTYQPYFNEGLAAFKKDTLWGFMDKEGTVVVKPIYKQVNAFFEGMAAVCLSDNKWGYINKKGEMVIKPVYAVAYRFSDGVAVVSTGKTSYDTDKLTGVINKSGKEIIPFEKRGISEFKNGRAVAESNYISYYLYKNGKTSLACDINTMVNARYAFNAIAQNDVRNALSTLKKDEGKNCPMTDYWLGYICLTASGAARDTLLGAKLVEQAAKNGYPEAMYSIGFTYLNGLGGKKDEALAKQWLIKASQAGIPVAFTVLGTMYEKTDPAQAATAYQQAADRGDAIAMYNLALLYRDGRGVTKNDYQFRTWLGLSAQRNYKPATTLQTSLMKGK